MNFTEGFGSYGSSGEKFCIGDVPEDRLIGWRNG